MPRQNDSEFPYPNSRDSIEPHSDDTSIEQALLQHYEAIRIRKRESREQKFLQMAEDRLNEEITATSNAVNICIQKMESLYGTFILDYASAEDKIRNLWDQILREDSKYAAALDELAKMQQRNGAKMEENMVSGLSKVRAACEDFKSVIEPLSSSL